MVKKHSWHLNPGIRNILPVNIMDKYSIHIYETLFMLSKAQPLSQEIKVNK